MKNQLITSAALTALFFGSAAMAADMPVKAPIYKAPPAAVEGWAGFYIGANAGGIWSRSDAFVHPSGCFLTDVACGGGVPVNPLRSDTGDLNKVGFLGGGQIGFNWQKGIWVFGVETDLDGASLRSTDSVNRPVVLPLVGNFIHSENERLDLLGTFRGRVGFTATPTMLLYATGGLAYGHFKSATNVSFTSTADTYAGSASTTRVGWTAGAGGEMMLGSNWSAKLEYLYVDLGNSSYTDGCTAPGVCTSPPQSTAATYQTDLKTREHILRIGINYHFGAGPLVARY